MSLDNENVSDSNLAKLFEITHKLNRCNKNVKLVLELLEKLSKASENKKQGGGFVEKGSAEYKNKKQVYLTKLNNKEIKQPRRETLNFYEIDHDEDAERYVQFIIIFFEIILLC